MTPKGDDFHRFQQQQKSPDGKLSKHPFLKYSFQSQFPWKVIIYHSLLKPQLYQKIKWQLAYNLDHWLEKFLEKKK